ncbi:MULTISPECIES: HD-GYP domain-containing protein [Rubrivivax]|uniref:Response regulator n=1 Tax=Rubrivivax benzoatilyticus TaxID=316997 RepID=A0ABX0HV98_9BURK|nr:MULTISPECIES: HD domain-containing phosphohydrolase [Rubrivivax]MCD0418195.1 response regulator [Rubrivivax sp. JA1024]EGJ11560.1 response regulator receiver modulated metal dependent phosphohydrolase [Rubrivivax benzoatilyticus JA2 = ATCC BAA-35]MCC9595942.1 response regulator [Rubrivivax sp. JA1055]MCC9647717.1 response regulator [Rubrivivax sp. JA1029]NHK97541.1 response regulator [Rubrivivax benzoatilyticus]
MPAALSPPSGPETILIVDDEPANLKILATILGDKGYRVIAASNGETALRLAERPPLPSLILLDVMMPDMSGMVVLEKLRENPATRAIPVVMVTALGKERDEETGLKAGASDYIKKPFSPLILLARVRSQLDAARLRGLLRDELQREKQLRDLEGDLMQTVVIRALAHLAETRDLETGNHILRTQKYVRVLAEDLRSHGWDLSDSTISLLERSAPLHDIGKVGIPDEVLLKKGKLTPDEWVTMKRHAAIGADAITRAEEDVQQEVRQRWQDGEIDDKTRNLLDCLRIAKEIAHRHHERWDGSGYPDGLAGEQIPRSARLMALADVFDALISKRCYKDAWDYGQARAVILEGRGTHFDPAVVEAFERCYDEFCRIATTFADPKDAQDEAADRAP